jgi:hypothetical protein
MNMQDQILEELGTQMHSAIDFEILTDVLVKSCGWHRIDLSKLQDNKHAVDITYWLTDNCQGKFHRNGRHFIFEDQGDAVTFTLKWL